MMEGNCWIGIDISKRQLDWQMNKTHNQPLLTGNVQNSPGGIIKLLEKAGICYVMVAAAQVQRSLGIQRGKTDAIDAERLAEYVWRFRDRLHPSQLPSKLLLELRSWLLWREKLVKMRTSLTNALKANILISRVVFLLSPSK